METTGLIHIYTGDGKGKTTSAVGLAARALGGGLKVCYVSFHKRPELYGYTEMDSLRALGAKVINFAKGHPHLDSSIKRQTMVEEVSEGLIALRDLLKKEQLDLLIMDEILISVRDNFIREEEVIDFIQSKPSDLELVLTGRGATPALIELADYVSCVQKIKHPFDRSVPSRKGIEY